MPQLPTDEQYKYLWHLAAMHGPANPLAVYLRIHGEGSATREQGPEILRHTRKIFASLKAQGWVREVRGFYRKHEVTYYRITIRGVQALEGVEQDRRKKK